MSNNIILLDFQNLLLIHAWFCKQEIMDGDRTKLISNILKIVTQLQQRLQTRNVLWCGEGMNDKNWRREYWSLYKNNRVKRKKILSPEDKIYNDRAFSIGNQIIENYLDRPDWNALSFPNTEADDIINVMAMHNSSIGGKVFIVSVDVDFYMLLKLPNVKIYNPRKNKIVGFPYTYSASKVVVNDPQILTDMCVCNGQTKDDIWNAKSTEKNKERFGEKTCFKMLINEDTRTAFYETYKDNIKRNDQILNPFSTPDKIKTQVVEGFNKLAWQTSTGGSLFDRMKRGEL